MQLVSVENARSACISDPAQQAGGRSSVHCQASNDLSYVCIRVERLALGEPAAARNYFTSDLQYIGTLKPHPSGKVFA
jgi:hypothetical protein